MNGGAGAVQRSLWSTRISEACQLNISSPQVEILFSPFRSKLITLASYRRSVFRKTKMTSFNTRSSARPLATVLKLSSSTTLLETMKPPYSLSFVAPYPFFRICAQSRASDHNSAVDSASVQRHLSRPNRSNANVLSKLSLESLRRSKGGTSHSSTVLLNYSSRRTTTESNRSLLNPSRA